LCEELDKVLSQIGSIYHITDITQEAERVIKSICYEQFRYQTAACNEILLDWFDIPQQSDELRLFGKFG
jgi:hypothetical protein